MNRAVIKVGLSSLYAAPKQPEVVIDEGLYGMEAEILEEVGSFTKVRMEYGYEGYLLTEHLEKQGWPEGEKLRVLARQIDVMKEPKVDSICLQTMPLGAVVLAAQGEALPAGWTAVQLLSGAIGYTKESFLAPYKPLTFEPVCCESQEQEAWLRQCLTSAAMLYEQTTYRWGGKTPAGIDCYGLCSMAYMLNGYAIYRDAQIRDGYALREIPVNQVKPGDLLFFKGHVAMYLGEEERQYIHSTAKAGSDGVDYNALSPQSPLYREDLANGILAAGSLFV